MYISIFSHNTFFFESFSSPAVKVSDSRLTELQNQCDEKENLIKELYEQCAEQTDDIEHFKEQVRRLQESLQNAKDEIDNLTSRFSFSAIPTLQTFTN